MIRRVAIAIAALFAIIAQMVAGIAGPSGGICVCSTSITIERAGLGCGPELADTSRSDDRYAGLLVVGEHGCTDCHLISLPDTAYLPMASAPAHPVAVVLPTFRTLVASIVWPPPPALRAWSQDRQRAPSGQHLRLLRTVVMTC